LILELKTGNNMTDTFTTTEQQASYGIGMQMGQQLVAAFKGVELAAAQAGIADAFNKVAPQVDEETVRTAFTEIQKGIEDAESKNADEHAGEGEAFLADNAKKEGITVTESGLQYEILEKGDGEIPTASSTVRTHYRGSLINGEEFDSSYSRNEPTEFPVNGVIKGWTEALQLMPVGSKWKLFIPYQIAYGAQGAGGSIGPYQALVFEIELLAIV